MIELLQLSWICVRREQFLFFVILRDSSVAVDLELRNCDLCDLLHKPVALLVPCNAINLAQHSHVRAALQVLVVPGLAD